ncbi:hypothetical protein MC28_0017 [Bacillus thuringiensis MC28]|nr:hypothetical protein MC28_0017 [Bacillus thuringiensis MC28]OTW79381.1 hypothetical protein BK702_28100 [Bacillus thuringiensis serovar cameroun]OTX13493.1 hypothetical protein BK712_01995 [Bacillus thuringiensis serovar seoulensis]PGC84872.1 hypothetical protein COM39_24560 [Bacillus toyonensis]PHC39213.1 hypothetical protein COF09_22035 [Bacillus toyonensis]
MGCLYTFALFLYIKGHFYEKERKDKKTDEKILIIRNVSV